MGGGLNSKYGTCTLCSQNCLTVSEQQRQLGLATRPVDLVAVKGKSEPTKARALVRGFILRDRSSDLFARSVKSWATRRTTPTWHRRSGTLLIDIDLKRHRDESRIDLREVDHDIG